MKLIKIVAILLAIPLAYLAYMLNRPTKFAKGACLKSDKGGFTLKITSVDRSGSAYGARVLNSNHSQGSFYEEGNMLTLSFDQIDDDKDLSQVGCVSGD